MADVNAAISGMWLEAQVPPAFTNTLHTHTAQRTAPCASFSRPSWISVTSLTHFRLRPPEHQPGSF